MASKSRRKRPFGVVVLVGLLLVTVAVQIAGLALFPERLPAIFGLGQQATNALLGSQIAVIVVTLVIAFGLWTLRRWAWFLVMLELGVRMAINLWLYHSGQPLYISMILSVVTVFYLNEREVQRAFERVPDTEEAAWTT